MVSKLDELCEQKTELQRQIHILDSQIKEEKKLQKQRSYENLCKCYKNAFLKDVKLFNSKENIEKDIKFGMEIKTPHYIIEFTHDGDYWHAEITDLHKSKFVVAVSLHKEEIKTVKQA